MDTPPMDTSTNADDRTPHDEARGSVFEADCPDCGIALQPICDDEDEDGVGLRWCCLTCGFTAERANGMVIGTMEPSTTHRDVPPADVPPADVPPAA